MIRTVLAPALAVAIVFGGAASAQRKAKAPASGDLVELDLVAWDKQNRPVTDLRKEEFEIKEDGRAMEIKTFAQVSARGSTERDDGRSVVLLLDDMGISMSGTTAMRAIAQVMLSSAARGDEVSVLRLSSRTDEAFGDFETARDRIDGYYGGKIPFSRREAAESALKAIANTSRTLEAVDHRRKVIICVGLRPVCNVEEPALGATSLLWQPWLDAIGAAARANVAVYAVDPTGVNAASGPRSNTITDYTGGELFANTNDFLRAADIIWREASHYYLLGYWPSAERRDTHSIGVKVTRKDVKVRARKRRAD